MDTILTEIHLLKNSNFFRTFIICFVKNYLTAPPQNIFFIMGNPYCTMYKDAT